MVLIGSVLLQPGKTDAGALFTSNVSSTAFAPRGTASVLAKFTIGAAIVFMLSALMISMPALSGNVSVLSGNQDETSTEATPSPTPAPATDATPVALGTIGPGGEQTITIAPDSNSNAASNSPAAPPANNNASAPAQSNPPANK